MGNRIYSDQWAYLAGLIDGEGNVGVYRHKDNRSGSAIYVAKIVLTSTSPELIAWLINNIGGMFWARKLRGNWKQCYSWSPKNVDETIAICINVLPYMVIKKQQILLLLRFPFRAGQGYAATQEIKDLKHELYEATLALNKVGNPDVGNNG